MCSSISLVSFASMGLAGMLSQIPNCVRKSQGFAVILLIWNVALGNSVVSAFTSAVMPMLAKAPLIIPHGKNRNCECQHFSPPPSSLPSSPPPPFPSLKFECTKDIPAQLSPQPSHQLLYSCAKMAGTYYPSRHKRRDGSSSGCRFVCGRRGSRGLCREIL